MKLFSEKPKTGEENGAEEQVTWYGVEKILFLRLGLSVILFLAGLLLPDNAFNVILMLLSVLIAGYDVIYRAIVQIVKEHTLGEELLITVVVILSFTINADYEAAAVMLIYQAGYLLRSYASALTRSNLLDRVDPILPYISIQQGEEIVSIDPEQVELGDLLIIHSGERVPVDCRLEAGQASIDLVNILGSNQQQDVEEGGFIPAGAINLGPELRARAESGILDSAYAREIHIASDDTLVHSSTEDDLEKYAAVFAPFALGLGILAALLMLIFSKVTTEEAIHRAMIILIVACPTAFLAPISLTYLAGLFRSVRHGVLVKGSAVLDSIARTAAVVLEKDDMLTTGQYRVLSVKSSRMDSAVLLKVAAHAGFDAQSPLIRSVTNAYEGIIDHSLIQQFTELENGVSAVIDGIVITMGTRELMEQYGIPVESKGADELAVYMALNGQYAGCIILGDVIREDARDTVMAVESTGCDCILLSGDTDERTRNAAANAGIREYHPQCMPLDRLEKIQEIKERFPSNSVLYVDYGGSDSSSLSAADVGVCLNGLGSETPFQAGDVVIMGRSMTPLADAIDSGKLTQRITRQTLLIILAEKLLLLLLALFGVTYQLWFALMVDVVAGIAGILLSSRVWE
ncbi:MAG: HAD-IC family P-type ATPase [Oscillospiraceae bacterium]|nr:HAD-IC family P-type ATPase [Oscillospiraceae bacterium]